MSHTTTNYMILEAPPFSTNSKLLPLSVTLSCLVIAMRRPCMVDKWEGSDMIVSPL